MKRKTKILSAIFALVMLVSLLPTIALAADSVTIGGGTEPIRLEVYNSGNIGVFINAYSPPEQFYAEYDYGVSWFINGQSYHTAYLSNSGIGIYPNALGSLGTGTLTQSADGRTATVTWNMNGIVLTTTYTLRQSSRMIEQTWTITNNTSQTINGAKLIAGGDTYFAGSDHGYGYWDNVQGACVFRDEQSGLMAFTPITQSNAHFIGSYYDGRNEARSGQLSNYVEPMSNRVDQSYYLQWNYDAIAPGDARTTRAVQSFAAAALVTATAPPPFSIPQGQATTAMFSLTNVTSDPQTVGLRAESTNGINVTFGTPSTSGTAGMIPASVRPLNSVTTNVTIPPRSSINVPVNIDIASTAPAGTGRVTLSVTGSNGSVISTVSSEVEIAQTSDWAQEDLARAAELGLIPDVLQNVDLSRPITRGEFTAVAVLMYEHMSRTTTVPVYPNPFSDTAVPAVLKANNVGLVNGYEDGTFRPNDQLGREQMATLLTRVLKASCIPGWTLPTDPTYTLTFTWPTPFADDGSVAGYARESVYFMVSSGTISGVGGNRFDPQAPATREMSLMLAARIVDRYMGQTLNYARG